MPDQEALAQIKQLDRLGNQYRQELEEQEALIEEEINAIKEEGKGQEDQTVTDQAIETVKGKIDAARA